MRKKQAALMVLLLILCGTLAGCGDTPAASDAQAESATQAPLAVEMDLTRLNSTMLYAQVFGMLNTNPDQYIGKVLKLRGPYVPSYYDVTGKYYHYIEITDNTACCSLGMEFIWAEGEMPALPAEGTEIEIIGTFGTYTELDTEYYCLKAAKLRILE